MLRRGMMAVTSGPSVTYSAWNPSDKTAGFALSSGNRIATENTSNLENVRATLPKTAGKGYVEVLVERTAGSGFNCLLGLRRMDEPISTAFNLGQTIVLRSTGGTFAGSSGATAGTGTSFTFGDRLMLAADFDAQLLWIGKNGTWMNGGNPAAGTGALFTGFTVGTGWGIIFCSDNIPTGHRGTINAGQVAFVYTVPSGFPPGWYA